MNFFERIKSSLCDPTHLGSEVFCSHRRVVLAVASHVSTTDLLDGHVLDVEADVITGEGLGKRLVVHLYRLDLSGQVGGSESDDHAGLQDTGLNAANWDSSNTWGKKDILLICD